MTADKLLTIPMQRKRDGQQRRRDLCDAAIQVIAEEGSRGLSHQRVDRCADVPDGTTSYYYRTRAALLRGVAERVAEIDTENLQSVIDEPEGSDPLTRLAQLVMMQATGSGLNLNKARHELMLVSDRDPELAEIQREFGKRMKSIVREAVLHLQVAGPRDDHILTTAQTWAVNTFISGVFTRFVTGDRFIRSADQLEQFLRAIVEAVPKEPM
ncbi:TetR family transcriptional regulator C-terminal domain-containing protein [soil metagenome]